MSRTVHFLRVQPLVAVVRAMFGKAPSLPLFDGALRWRFVTASTVAPSWNRWNFLQYAVTRIADRYALVIVPPSNVSSVHWPFLPTARVFTSRVTDRCGTNIGNCYDAQLTNYTCTHWHLPESGIWELSVEAHYVAGKVMSWVVLERAAQISRLTGFGEDEELVRATIRRPKMGASHPRSSPLLCGDSLSGSFSRLLLALNSAGK